MPDTATTIRQAIRDFVAPEIKEIKGDIKTIDARLESMHTEIHICSDSMHTEISSMHPEIGSIRSEMHSFREGMQAEMHSFRSEILGAIQNATLRGDLETSRQLADIRERVTRLEERQPQRQ